MRRDRAFLRKVSGVLGIAATVLVGSSCNLMGSPAVEIRLVATAVLKQSDIPSGEKWWNAQDIPTPLFRVRISSNFDLQRLAKEDSYSIGIRTSFCKNGAIDQSKRIDGFPHVGDSHGMIYTFRNVASDPPSSDSGNAQPRFVYNVFFDARQSGIYGFRDFDLVRSPADVCIQVRGIQEQWAGKTFVSNVVALPKEVVRDAILKSHLYGSPPDDTGGH